MSEVLNGIRTRVGEENLSTLRSRSSCGVNMTEAPSPRVVIDADRAFPAHGMMGKRCDYIIFFCDTAQNCLVAVLIELKGGDVKASEVSEQLQAGANFAERFTPGAPEAVCLPCLFHKGIHKREFQQLQRASVRFRGEDTPIKTARCDSPLIRALS
ncbi:hypothetical protein J4G02_17465 [Candidatus Poribacteria bacterium]|nr:hypothetical protein [Candidatus Poribacteria bacterium]